MSKPLSVMVILVFALGIIASTFAQESPVVITTQGTQVSGSAPATYTFSARAGQIILVTAIAAPAYPEIRITPPDDTIERYLSNATKPLLFRAPADGVYTLRVEGFQKSETTGDYTLFIREVLPIPLAVDKPRQLPAPSEQWQVFSFSVAQGDIIDVAIEHATARKLIMGIQSSSALYVLGLWQPFRLSQQHTKRHVLIRSTAMQLLLLDFGADFQQSAAGFTITVSRVPIPLLDTGTAIVTLGGKDDETQTAFATANVRAGTTYRVILREMNGKPLRLRMEFDVENRFKGALGVSGTTRFMADMFANDEGRLLLTLKNQAKEAHEVEVSLEMVDNSS